MMLYVYTTSPSCPTQCYLGPRDYSCRSTSHSGYGSRLRQTDGRTDRPRYECDAIYRQYFSFLIWDMRISLPNGISFRPTVMTGCTSVTDGQKDRRTDRRTTHVTVMLSVHFCGARVAATGTLPARREPPTDGYSQLICQTLSG